MELLTCGIPPLAGPAAAEDVRFLGWELITPALARYGRQLSATVRAEMLRTGGSALEHPVLAAQAAATLAAAALAVFPNSTLTRDPPPDPDPAASSALERAVDHLRAHPGAAISVTELAAVAGVTARAPQYAFRDRYGTSPLGYHRQVRLAAAHRDLLAADPAAGTTVAEVAARWGFPNAGRFARYYRRMYDQPPSRTLHS